MASTAVHYPMDKDQNRASFWADNEEAVIAGDNFFDQFVTFDTGDAAALSGEILGDPPSPSLLLDSLQNGLNNSYTHHFDWPLNNSRVEGADVIPLPPVAIGSETNSADQVSPNPAILTALAADPVLSNGSISDSELLRLEGISLKSPRENVTEPSSPVFATPVRTSPRKHKRFVETIYATIRRAAHRSKSPKKHHLQPADMVNLDTFLGDPGSALGFDMKYDDPRIAVKPEPMVCDGLPLSPPLTGRIPNDTASGFISGNLDDPFCDRLEAPAIIYPSKCRNVTTPASTPMMNGEAFFPSEVMVPVNANIDSYRQLHRAHRSTNSAEWPTEGLLTNGKYNEDANVWNNGNGNPPNPGWWDAAQKSEILHGNAAHNMSMHSQQTDLPYEYSTEFSGLLIHMPRPRAAQASVLTAPLNEHTLAKSTLSPSSYPTPSLSHAHQHHYGSKGHGHTERRPRPRAPSSGARHHGSQSSPRKLRHSHSLGYLREQSLSPSPSMPRHAHPNVHPHALPHHHHASHQERRQQRSSSLTMRKQRSFTRREPRTPGSRPGSSGGGGGGGGGGGSGGGFGLDFVNYTPNDGNVLMTGVAPSGSSKTKARREKEAMERSRRMSELAIKAVQENGGDVSKLMGDIGQFALDR